MGLHHSVRFCRPLPSCSPNGTSECGVRSAECRVQSAECAMSAVLPLRHSAFCTPHSAFGSRPPHKVRDGCWHAGVETDYVQHPAVVGVGQGEAVGGRAHNDRPGVAGELIPILPQRL